VNRLDLGASMSAAAVEGPGSAAQLEAAMAANSGADGAYDHDSEDNFQYEEVEVPRYVAFLPPHPSGALFMFPPATPSCSLHAVRKRKMMTSAKTWTQPCAAYRHSQARLAHSAQIELP
jgi:hypothetical protein